jgi:deoxyribodipyrimidine photo-lyase
MAPIIHWFRRDLRLNDNTALHAAGEAAGGAIIPLFIIDDRLFRGRFASPARSSFLLASLRVLAAMLAERGSRLIIRRGEPLPILLDLARHSGAAAAYWNRDYSPFAIERDSTIKQSLREQGLDARSFKDLVCYEIDEILSKEGKPYTVYTPYARRWHVQLVADGYAVLPAPELVAADRFSLSKLDTSPIPEPAEFGMTCDQSLPAAGEIAGRDLLGAFTDLRHRHHIGGYQQARDLPALPATSRLSAHLRLGTLSVRQCLAQAFGGAERGADAAGVQAWVGELAWREFYIQVLYHHPHVLRGAFKPQYDTLEWENDAELFAAWTEGRCGYPIVDAAMRQLRREAWMHNRCRMIVASFLTKDLLIDWRWGERYFMQQLVDGDPAANNGGWQWAAGTGTDAQPYFRIFNPTSQGTKFDPAGDYVRRYVPELQHVPDKYIHEPWKMPPAEQRRAGLELGRDYPRPIVDHKEQRERALEMYRRVR